MADEARSIVYTVDVNTGDAVSDINRLTDETEMLENQLEKTKSVGQRFADILELGAGLTGGIAAFQGVVTLAGVENDKLTESLTRLMALQSTLGGLQQTANLFRQEEGELTRMLTSAIKAKNWVMKQSIILQGAMAAGIGLVITAIVLAAQEFKEYQNQVNATAESMEAMATAGANARVEVNKVGKAFEDAEAGLISKEAALQVYNDTLGTTLGTTNDYNVAEENFINNSSAYIKATELRAQANKLYELSAETMAENVKTENEATLKWWQVGIQAFKVYTKDYVGLLEFTAEKDKENTQATIEENQKKIDAYTDLATELANQAIELEMTFTKIKEDTEALTDAIQIDIQEFTQEQMDADEELLEWDDSIQKEKEAREKRNDDWLEKGLAKRDKRREDEKQAEQDRLDWLQYLADREAAIQQAKLAVVAQTVGGISQLIEASAEEGSKAADFAKVLAIFEIQISSALALSKALAAAAGNPIAVAAAYAQMIPAFATIIRTVNSIGKAPTFDGGGSSTATSSIQLSSGMTTGSFSTGEIIEEGTGGPEIIETGARGTGGTSETLKVVVLESDITQTQNDVAFVETVSSF